MLFFIGWIKEFRGLVLIFWKKSVIIVIEILCDYIIELNKSIVFITLVEMHIILLNKCFERYSSNYL